jgi:ABC-type hemin transport system ATPase subunit
MRMNAKRAGCVVIAAALTLLGSATARADDASLVRAATELGFGVSAVNLISMGHSACYFLSRNRDPGQVVERIMRYGQVQRDSAQRFLSLSVAEYCPQYRPQIGQ